MNTATSLGRPLLSTVIRNVTLPSSPDFRDSAGYEADGFVMNAGFPIFLEPDFPDVLESE